MKKVSMESLGGGRVHTETSGVAHFLAPDDVRCLKQIRQLLGYLPSNNAEDPPEMACTDDPERVCDELDALVPSNPNKPYDIKTIVYAALDDKAFFEVQERFAPNMVVGFGRIAGRSVGVVANQPQHLAGCLDIHASVKAARFVRFCDCFGIPIRDFCRRSWLFAGQRSGAWRHHQARSQALVRFC